MAQPQVRRNTWDGPPDGRSMVDTTETELLHVYIYDYCKKHNFNQAARFFAAEANVTADQRPPIDIATGFLADWWGVFWDVYHAQNKDGQASKGINDEYHDLVRSRKEEVLQQQRNFSMQQAIQQQQQQQQQLRRASEMQRLAQSPQLHHNTQQAHAVQPPHVPSQQQQQQLMQSRDHRSSPVNSIASLPNGGGMAPPNNNVAGGPTNGNSIVNTPQTIPASLPQQQSGNNRMGTSSPSFSPQQVQRPGVPSNGANENVLGHPDAMMNSPMVNAQGMPMNAQGQMMMNQRVAVSPHNAIIINIMNALGLGGRDPQSLTPEERANVQAHIRRHTMQMNQPGMMRNPNMMAVNNQAQAQARLQMQQQMMANQQILQQQQQQQQRQQQMHHNQPQTPQMQRRMSLSQPQPLQQQQQYMPHSQNQLQQQAQTPQQQAQPLPQSQHGQPPNQPQQGNQVPPSHHQALGQPQSQQQHGIPQPNHLGGNSQAGNGQRIPTDNVHSSGPMANNPEQFGGGEGMNMMMAEQMMKSGQLSGLTPQQQQQFMMDHYHQQQRMLFNHRRMMQQQGGQTPPNPNMMSPAPPAPMNAGSPQDTDKNNASLAQYQRQQLQYTMQQRQQYNQQQQQQPVFSQDSNNNPNQSPQMNRKPSQQQTPNQKRQSQQPVTMKRQRTSNDSDGQQNANQSPSPHLINSTTIPPNAHTLPGSSHVSPVIPQPGYSQDPANVKSSQSPQMDRGMAKPPTPQQSQTRTPQQAPRQLLTQGTPAQAEPPLSRMGWNPSPLGDGGNMQSSGLMDGPKSPSSVGMDPTYDNGSNMVSSFDLERFMMSDGGDFGEIFTQEQNLLMGNDSNELFGGGFLSNMNNGGFGGGGGGDKTPSLNSSSLLQVYGQLTGHTNKVSTVAFSSDGQWLASAGHDKKVLVWSVQEKQLRWTLEGHGSQITCARWSPDQRNWLVTSSYDKSLRVWDLDQAIKEGGDNGRKPIAQFNCKAQITAVDFAPTRPDTICSLDAEGELNVWHIPSGKTEKTIKLTASKSLFAANPLRFHPRLGKILACAAGNQIFVINIDAAKNNASNGGDSGAVRTINAEHSKNICSLDWSVDGNYLVTASENEVMVYETGHWKLINKHAASDKIQACAFLISGGGETGGATGARKLCVVYGCYESIYVWQCNVPGSQPQLMGRQSGMVAGLACIQRNGQPVVASASHYKEKNLMLWTL